MREPAGSGSGRRGEMPGRDGGSGSLYLGSYPRSFQALNRTSNAPARYQAPYALASLRLRPAWQHASFG
jgi:hypothetical protein